MNSFSFWSPTKIVFGADTARCAGQEVKLFGSSNILVLYGGGSAVKSGLLDKVSQSLTEAGLQYHCVGGIQPNPRAELAQQIVDAYWMQEIDFVLGVGGGSVIDTGKAVAHGFASPQIPVWDFFSGKAQVTASLPVGAILTIAAAGSETSDSAVLTNQALGEKRGLSTPFNRPKFTLMDPTLTYTLPPRHTACGVTDILMHTLDRYFAPDTDNAVTDGLAESLMRTVIQYGRHAMEKPNDYKARSELMWAGSLSHNGLTGLGQSKDFAVHQLGHALSARYDIPHGESLSAVWGAWAKTVCRENIARFAQYARYVWLVTDPDDITAAYAGIARTVEYFRSLGMPVTITQAAGPQSEEDIDELTELCSYHGTRRIGSFKVLDAHAIRTIYNLAK
ncbi:MAG: iron-containing alcohol dehydrogenase [Clostridiales bacterium]|nr:iron-containing alcohol dehydrogenase [Clostridiales bacterium]